MYVFICVCHTHICTHTLSNEGEKDLNSNKQAKVHDAAQQEAKHREAETRNCISAQVLSQSAPGQVKTRFNRNP
uniref:Uncharacterized protein n=1 Tax=Piliocolobus tephrosceles TaxID=591936 RepID=A0A8C9ILU9_9PRIM